MVIADFHGFQHFVFLSHSIQSTILFEFANYSITTDKGKT